MSNMRGTTRDAIDTDLTLPDGRSFKLIDTAGIRRRAAVAGALSSSITTQGSCVKGLQPESANYCCPAAAPSSSSTPQACSAATHMQLHSVRWRAARIQLCRWQQRVLQVVETCSLKWEIRSHAYPNSKCCRH